MKIYIGADHRGHKLKEELKPWLTGLGHEVIDMVAKSYNPDDDYVDFAVAVVQKLLQKSSRANFSERGDLTRLPRRPDLIGTPRNDERGILICGSGVGVCIAANRFKGIRCGLGLSPAQVTAARNDDNINILSLATDYTDINSAKDMVKAFLETAFSEDERYLRRLKKIDKLFVIASDPPAGGERGDLVGIAASSRFNRDSSP